MYVWGTYSQKLCGCIVGGVIGTRAQVGWVGQSEDRVRASDASSEKSSRTRKTRHKRRTLPLSSISLMNRWQGEGIKFDGYILLQCRKTRRRQLTAYTMRAPGAVRNSGNVPGERAAREADTHQRANGARYGRRRNASGEKDGGVSVH